MSVTKVGKNDAFVLSVAMVEFVAFVAFVAVPVKLPLTSHDKIFVLGLYVIPSSLLIVAEPVEALKKGTLNEAFVATSLTFTFEAVPVKVVQVKLFVLGL